MSPLRRTAVDGRTFYPQTGPLERFNGGRVDYMYTHKNCVLFELKNNLKSKSPTIDPTL